MKEKRFTSRFIESLKSVPDKRIEYWDESFPGFGIRVSVEGRKSWVFIYRFLGRPRRMTLGTFPSLSLAEARRQAEQARYEVAMGKDPGINKQMERKAETFGQLADEYLEKHAKPKKRSWSEDQRILRCDFLPYWKNMKATSINRRDVIVALDRIMERNAPILANKALAVVRKLFNFAIQRDVVSVNPCWNVSSPGKIKSRDRVLTEGELKAFGESLSLLDYKTGSYYQLLILTAQRPGELANAKWSEFDLNNRWWVIPAERAKNGLAHRVPLSTTVLNILKSLKLQTGKSKWLFPSEKGDYPICERKRQFQKIKELMGISFVTYDLRRTASSFMTSSGIPRLTVSKILNHVESSVTAVYDRHSYDKEKRDALELWAVKLKDIFECKNEISRSQESFYFY